MSYEEREQKLNILIENVKDLLESNDYIIKNEIFTKISNLLTFDFEVNNIFFSITYYHKKEENFCVFLNYQDYPRICSNSPKNIVNKIIEILNDKKKINFDDWNMNYL